MVVLLKRRQVYVHNHKRRRLKRRITSLGMSVLLLLGVSFAVGGIVNAKRRTTRSAKLKTATEAAVSSGFDVHQTGKAKTATPGGTVTATNKTNTSPTQTTQVAVPDNCDPNKNINKALVTSPNPQLRKLAEYTAVCNASQPTFSLVFSGIPRTNEEANQQADDIAATLAHFSMAGITPYVIVEPQYAGEKIDLATLQTSNLGGVFEYYLNVLKTKGVTDEEAGTWVLFPEPNIPEWTTVDPVVFKTNFISFGMLFKQYFKTAKLSLMLNSMSYTTNDYSSSGSYASLLPYTDGIPAGLVDSFGYQGFPWQPAAGSNDTPSFKASDFLKPSLAVEAAANLGVQNVWLNTGTFASTTPSRSSILSDILDQTSVLQKSGLKVSVNLFAEDKSATPEAVDWSYWKPTQAAGSDGAAAFAMFSSGLHDLKVPLGIFDSY